MQVKAVVSAVMAMSLVMGGGAFAQASGNLNLPCDGGRSMCPPVQGYGNNEQQYHRGAGPDHAYYPGKRLPDEYRSWQYVVDDWRGHNLSAPPRGYHWVQTGSDYVLVANATGIIRQLRLSN